MMSSNLQIFGALLLLGTSAMAQFACIQVVTTTIALQPPLIAHTTGATCPTQYISVDGRGVCCTAAGTARYSGGSIACCPCGAFCTGDYLAPQTWNQDAATSSGSVSAQSTSVTAPVTVTQVSSGGASASTVVMTYSPSTSAGSVTIISGTQSMNSTATGSSASNSTMASIATTLSTGVMPTSTGGPVTGGTSGAETEFLLSPVTFISGAFVALFCARALWVQ